MKNAFDIERKRQDLAKQKDYKALKRLYRKNLATIPDDNTPGFWDRKNKERKNIRRENPMAFHKYKKVVKRIPSKASVLNIGAGSGELEHHFFQEKRASIRWCGIDISPQSVSKLKRDYPKGSFRKADILALPFENHEFDVVTILDVLEHIPLASLFTALKEIKRVVKRNGTVIISVPVNEGLEELVKQGQNPNAHVRMYTKDLLEAELVISGFTIIHTETLFAFGRFYRLKSFLCRYILKHYRHPNLLILSAQPVK